MTMHDPSPRGRSRFSHAPYAVRALATALSTFCLTAGGAWGADGDPVGMGKVEVTGSRIKRVDTETALPVQVITRADIESSGWTTASELLAEVSANFNSIPNQASIGTGLGHAYADLRGLNPTSTLILLNGRRVANHSFYGHAVDLNSIPIAALERVEILKDGASSIYGSDAIAGVINFITRKDFRGIEATAQGSLVEHGGADHRQATLTLGWGDLAADRFNAFATLDWQKDSGIAARDRPFARTVFLPDEGVDRLSNSTFPANIYAPRGATLSPAAAAGCAPPVSIPRAPGQGRAPCGYDYASAIDIVPPTEQVSALGRATYQLAPEHQLFGEYLYTYTDLLLHIAASPATRGATIDGQSIYYPAGGPYYPTAFAAANGLSGDLPVAFRTAALGPRADDIRSTSQRLVVGAQGEFGRWSYDAAFNHSENTATDSYRSGYVSVSALVDAMATGLVNPFGPSGQDGIDLLRATQITGEIRRAKGTMDQVDLRTSAEIFELPAGPLALAFGVESRHEHLTDQPASVLSSGDILGGGSQIDPADSRRRVDAAFVEFNVPILRGLELQASARYDRYSDFGSTTNPKLALRWQPMKTLLLRASWGTGFHAPDLDDLYRPQAGFVVDGSQFADPIRCPVTKSDADCALAYTVFFGGNPKLKPERSTQSTAGVVWEPVAGNSIALDYWRIAKTDAVDTVNDDAVFAHYDAYAASNVIRGPVDPAYPNLPGPITGLIEWSQNVGNYRTWGIDVDAVVKGTLPNAGRLTARLNATWIGEWSQHLNALAAESLAGAYSIYGPVPRWRHHASLTWDYGSWSTTVGQTFQAGYTDQNPAADGNSRRVGSYEVWDLQATYRGFRNLSLAGGVRNLFDRAPPFTNQGNSFQVGYDPSYADPRGRAYYARLTYAFK